MKTPIGPLLHLIVPDTCDRLDMCAGDQHNFLRIICEALSKKQEGAKSITVKELSVEADVPFEIAFIALLNLVQRKYLTRDLTGYRVTGEGWQFYYAHTDPPTL